MKVEERAFQTVISPYDVRDYKVVATGDTVFPETFELAAVTVKNQGSTSSCVAHACSSVVEYHNTKQEKTKVSFSTEFIYGYRPIGYFVGKGMYLRNALKTLQKLGNVPLDKLKGNHEYKEAMKIVKEKLEELKPIAYPNRISSYAKVKKINDIKQALVNHGPVIVAMPWYKDYKLKNGVYTWTKKEKRGYHCVFIYGWDERGWLVQNSWGSNWGQKGKFVVPFDFKWTESWAVIDDIKAATDVVKPADNKFIKVFSKVINFFVNLFRKNK